jgi:5-methylcytosine-specific restriction endonuclease McrA
MHSVSSLPFQRNKPKWSVWNRTKDARFVVRNLLVAIVSGVEPVNDAASKSRPEYPPQWSRTSRWVRGHAGWRCELCGVKNGPPPNLLTVHHLDNNKWNLLPWNLAALCQSCHRQVQWTLDFCQSTLTDIYPEWLRQHVRAYNAWAQTKGRVRLAVADR